MDNSIALPPSGKPPAPTGRTFMSFNGKDGLFHFNRGKDTPDQTTDFVTGYLGDIWLEWDLGHKGSSEKNSVPARWELNLQIESPDLGSVRLDVGPAATVYSLAAQVMQVGKGTFIGITLLPGKDATLTNLAVWDGTAWHHIFCPKADGVPIMQRYERILGEIQTHSAWNKPAQNRRKDVVEPELPKIPEAESSGSGGGSGAGEQGKAGSQGSGEQRSDGSGEQSSNPSAQVGPAPGVPYGELLTAYGFSPTKSPGPAQYQREAAGAIIALLDDKLQLKGVAAAVRQTAIDVILKAFKVDYEARLTEGAAALAISFLKNAEEHSIEAFKKDLESALASDDGEYNPFEDE